VPGAVGGIGGWGGQGPGRGRAGRGKRRGRGAWRGEVAPSEGRAKLRDRESVVVPHRKRGANENVWKNRFGRSTGAFCQEKMDQGEVRAKCLGV